MNSCLTCKHSGEAYSFEHEPSNEDGERVTLLPCEHLDRKRQMSEVGWPGVVFSFQSCWRWEEEDGPR